MTCGLPLGLAGRGERSEAFTRDNSFLPESVVVSFNIIPQIYEFPPIALKADPQVFSNCETETLPMKRRSKGEKRSPTNATHER